jgi:hypothetical protein
VSEPAIQLERERLQPRGIPTLYRSVMFRSRSEARWAAFFDELGWPWSYEPVDLDGYIPDFALPFDAGTLLVEVKGAADTLDELLKHERKIERSGWDREALIVGAMPWDVDSAQPLLGWFGERERIAGSLEYSWGDARLFECISCGRASLLAACGSWRCRVCGEGIGNEHVGAVLSTVAAKWATASNRVQWKGPGA